MVELTVSVFALVLLLAVMLSNPCNRPPYL